MTQAGIRRLVGSRAYVTDAVDEAARCVLDFGEDLRRGVELVVAGGVGLVVTDQRVEGSRVSGLAHADVGEPLRQLAAQVLVALRVAVRHDGEGAPGEM